MSLHVPKYPFGGRPFGDPLDRAGSVYYRTQLKAQVLNTSGRNLPVLLTEAGWKGPNDTETSSSIVAAERSGCRMRASRV